MRKLAILLCVLGVAAFANAANIQYKLLINGEDLATVDTSKVPVGTEFTVAVQVNVPDADFGGGLYGGVMGVGYNLSETGTALAPKTTPVFKLPPAVPTAGMYPVWVTTFNSAFTITVKGEPENSPLAMAGFDIYGQTHAFQSADEPANYFNIGAGPGVWTTISSGTFTWDGNATTLTVSTDILEWCRVATLAGKVLPESVTSDSVAFVGVPEPATMGLLLVGGVAALIRRRK